MTGTIKKWSPERRFGFIRAGNGQDVFFHGSSASGSDSDWLRVGQEVDFDLQEGEKGPKAANVRASRNQQLS
jgi:CspA family cold shock protein